MMARPLTCHRYNEVEDIVARNFPDAVKRGDLPNNGSTPSIVTLLDTSKTHRTFGLQLTSYEKSVTGVIGHYLELLEKERASKQ
jgi:hypothetical protein